MNAEVVNIPIDRIRVPNPRYRDKKKFSIVVESIRKSGLKKPIQVTRRASKPGEEPFYDLVCGQGRKEAFHSKVSGGFSLSATPKTTGKPTRNSAQPPGNG